MFRVRLSRDIGVAVFISGLVACATALPRGASAQEAEETISPRSSLSDALRSFRISKDSSNHTAGKSQSGNAHVDTANSPATALATACRRSPEGQAQPANLKHSDVKVASHPSASQPLPNKIVQSVARISPVKAVERAGIKNGVTGTATISTSQPATAAVKKLAPDSSPTEHVLAAASSVRHGGPSASVSRHATVVSSASRNVAWPPRVLPHANANRQVASRVTNKPQPLESRSNDSRLSSTTPGRTAAVVSRIAPAAPEQPVVSIASPAVPSEHRYAPLPGPGIDTHQASAAPSASGAVEISGNGLSNETRDSAAPPVPVRLLPASMPMATRHMMPVVADNPNPPAPRDDGVHAPFVDVTNGRNGHKHVSVHLPFIHVEHDGEQGHTQVRAPLVNVDKAQGQPASVHAPFTHVAPDATGQGTSVRAPMTSVNKMPGQPAQVKAPFTKVQNDGRPGNVSVHAPLVKVEKKPGQEAAVHAPFTKVNTEPKNQ